MTCPDYEEFLEYASTKPDLGTSFEDYYSLKPRFETDTPVVIPSLKIALSLFAEQSSLDSIDQARVFRTLLHFFGALLSPQIPPINDRQIQVRWFTLRLNFYTETHPTYYSRSVHEQADEIIEQLNAVATYRELERLAQRNVDGRFQETINYGDRSGRDYYMAGRGYDWILRCVFELNIPLEWRIWTSLMYTPQPCRSGPRYDDISDLALGEGYGHLHSSFWIAGRRKNRAWAVPIVKFWLRQAFTVLGLWYACIKYGGDFGELMPTYNWCAAAYEKMWIRFKNDLQDPFSEYEYLLREHVLRYYDFKTVFEDSWEVVMEACGTTSTEGVNVEDLNSYHARAVISRHVRENVQCLFRFKHGFNFSYEDTVGKVNEDEWAELCREPPEVDFEALKDNLPIRTTLLDGLCNRWYDLPIANAWPSRTVASEDDMEDIWEYDGEYELTKDVEMESYGPLIDINQFTVGKRPDVGDFCTWCQEKIKTTDSGQQRCVVPTTCPHAFHAGCLAAWVNGASLSSNACPNCKVQMTLEKRPRRQVD